MIELLQEQKRSTEVILHNGNEMIAKLDDLRVYRK
jgi:hypothetical protein